MNAARTSAFIIYGVRRQKMRNETHSEKDLEEFQRDFIYGYSRARPVCYSRSRYRTGGGKARGLGTA